MPDENDGEKAARNNAGAPAKQTAVEEQDHDLEAVKPSLTGIIGMHIDQRDEDAASGSPGADIDRNLAEEK